MNDNAEIKLELLANHYSETFALLKSDVARRDKLFLYMLILLSVILLYLINPEMVSQMFQGMLSNLTGTENGDSSLTELDLSFVAMVLWFGLLSLVHTYFQIVLHIQRQYDYVYGLEELLSNEYGN